MEKVKVAIVDDNSELVKMMEEYLSNHGEIEVISTATNGKQCLKMFENVRRACTRCSVIRYYYATS